MLQVQAQEVVFPLGSNAVLESAEKRTPQSGTALRVASISDTVALPFVDDFSKPGVYPDAALWLDSGAFINSTFCDQPVTVGVATLDGLQSNGRPYDSISGITRICDYLTSNPIDLNFPNDNTIWFSFFFQPQGLGDQPETADSLALEFRNDNGNWENVWSTTGKPDTAFLQVFIQVNNTAYQYKGFQFRFLNYATPNGNRDHWNLDYIRLDRNRSQNDGISDVAFQYPQRSWLAGIESMPYTHYNSLATPNAFMVDSVRDTVVNLDFANTAMDHTFRCIDESNNVIFNQTKNVQIFTGTRIVVDGPLRSAFTFPSGTADSAVFHIECYKSLTGSFNSKNDTVRYDQKFYNYYAYDDGTAELAYGVNDAGAKIAYRFVNQMADTLRGVQMYFNPSGDQVHNKLLQLCYWSSIGYGGHSENLVYKRIDMKPANRDSINGFVFYAFDTAQFVPAGEFYVGWTQNDATLLGLGLDMNTPDTTNKFYSYQGTWYQSTVRGAWMMRPVFGHQLPTGIPELRTPTFSTYVNPNPGDGRLHIEISGSPGTDYRLYLYDLYGRLVADRRLESRDVDFSQYPSGMYVLKIENLKDHSSVQTKLIFSK
jgi:hypothetical protein